MLNVNEISETFVFKSTNEYISLCYGFSKVCEIWLRILEAYLAH